MNLLLFSVHEYVEASWVAWAGRGSIEAREKVAMFVGRGAGEWVEVGLVESICPHRLGHFVEDFEDDALGAVLHAF